MNLKDAFEIASASIIGRDHRALGKNNQDAFSLVITDDFLAAVVTDGCGSGPQSDLGAKFGARLATRFIHSYYRSYIAPRQYSLSIGTWKERLEGAFQNMVTQLTGFARDYADIRPRPEDAPRWWDCVFDWKGCVRDCLLFTVVGFAMTPYDTLIFSLGDGLLSLNGETKVLGPFPDNAPPYIGYNIIKNDVSLGTDFSQLMINAFLPTEKVESILIGTDGAVDFAESAEKNIPGRDESVGPLSQFWENDFYFRNPDALRRRLAVANADVVKPDWEERRLVKHPGLLRDDTTLVVLRRKRL